MKMSSPSRSSRHRRDLVLRRDKISDHQGKGWQARKQITIGKVSLRCSQVGSYYSSPEGSFLIMYAVQMNMLKNTRFPISMS